MPRKRSDDRRAMATKLTKPARQALEAKVKDLPALSELQQRSKKQQSGNATASFRKGIITGAVAGAVGMFMLDPRTGRRRRALVRDKFVKFGHTMQDAATETLPRRVDYMSGFAKGMSSRAGKMVGGGHTADDDDQTISDRVESIVFRDPDLPKGQININTVQGVVYLRGQVETSALADEIAGRVRKVEGVRDVINLINKPDVDPSQLRMQSDTAMS